MAEGAKPSHGLPPELDSRTIHQKWTIGARRMGEGQAGTAGRDLPRYASLPGRPRPTVPAPRLHARALRRQWSSAAGCHDPAADEVCRPMRVTGLALPRLRVRLL